MCKLTINQSEFIVKCASYQLVSIYCTNVQHNYQPVSIYCTNLQINNKSVSIFIVLYNWLIHPPLMHKLKRSKSLVIPNEIEPSRCICVFLPFTIFTIYRAVLCKEVLNNYISNVKCYFKMLITCIFLAASSWCVWSVMKCDWSVWCVCVSSEPSL